MEDKKEKVFELVLQDEMEDGVSTISFVEHPAIEEDFMFFSKEIEPYRFAQEGDKYMVTGPAMIPNQKIVRMTEDNQKYYVIFSEETVAKCNELFFKRAQHISSNVEHMFAIDGVTVIESWIVEDSEKDKSIAMGFKGFPKGTWMVTYKVDNQELWNKIKNGDVKGFSIEGKFIEDMIEMKSEKDKDKNKDPKVPKEIRIWDQIDDILRNERNSNKAYDDIQKILTDNGIIFNPKNETEE